MPHGEAVARWGAQEARSLGCAPHETLWMMDCELSQPEPGECLAMMLLGAFQTHAHIRAVVVLAMKELDPSQPGLSEVFTQLSFSVVYDCYLYICERQQLVPFLNIRPARVSDHDDMLPVFRSEARRLPELARMPESARPEVDFALTRLVEDPTYKVVVGHDQEQLIGILALTEDPGLEELRQAFDLEVYGNLEKEVEIEVEAPPRRAGLGPGSDGVGVGGEQESPGADASAGAAAGEEGDMVGEGEEAASPGAGDTEQVGEAGTEPAMEEGAAAADAGTNERPAGAEDGEGGAGAGDVGADEGVEIPGEGLGAEEEEESPVEDTTLAGAKPSEPAIVTETTTVSNAFKISMLCLVEAFELQSLDIIAMGFAAYPDRDYCVAQVPYSTPEPKALRSFSVIPPRADAEGQEDVLYVLHKHALLPNFSIATAEYDAHLEGVSSLTHGMEQQGPLLAAFSDACERGRAFVALCYGQVVGLVTLDDDVDVPGLRKDFDLDSLVQPEYHPREKIARLSNLIVNPIFSSKHRLMISESLRLSQKTCLLYVLQEDEAFPDFLEGFAHVSGSEDTSVPGWSSVPGGKSLFACPRRMCFSYKNTVSSRIVVSGVSDCSLGFLEKIMFDEETYYPNVTLLTSGTLKDAVAALDYYTPAEVDRLGLTSMVNVIEGTSMDAVHRDARAVTLSTGKEVLYDALVVAEPGKDRLLDQFGFGEAERVLSGPSHGKVMPASELETRLKDMSRDDVEDMSTVLVYGDSLQAHATMGLLQEKGVMFEDIMHMSPNRSAFMDGPLRLLNLAANQARIMLPPVIYNMQLEKVEVKGRVVCTFRNVLGRLDTITCDLLVTAHDTGVSHGLFQCLNDSAIVYDGGIIVDANFRTNDKNIFAAGKCTKFSRRIGEESLMHSMNQKEVGRRLKDSVAANIGASALRPTVSLADPESPVVLRTKLCWGHTFVIVGMPQDLGSMNLEVPRGSRFLRTVHVAQFTCICVDAADCVAFLVTIGPAKADPRKLKKIVGLPLSYLGDAEGAEDLLGHLTQPWVDALFLPGFARCREEMLRQVQSGASLAGAAHDLLLSFAAEHVQDLPRYHVPA